MVLINGKVVTMDPGDRIADTVAVKHGRIVNVGTNTEIGRMATEDINVLNVSGKTILPGLIDSNTHLEATAVHLAHMARIQSPPARSRHLQNTGQQRCNDLR